MIEPEIAFCDLDQLMDLEEDFLKAIVKTVLEKCPDELAFLDKFTGDGLLDKLNSLLGSIQHQAYENGNAEADKADILLDEDSTITQVAQAAQTLGYDISDEDLGQVCKALIQVCEKKGSVGAKEFESLIASFAMQAPSTYHLESYTTSCGNLTSSMSQVTLRSGDEILCGVSTGDGPIDSVFRAIEQCIGHHYELDDFQIQAVTEGKEALGSALVRLRNNGKLYAGNGSSTDIVAASIRAYINALNKIVYEEA